MKLLTTGSMNYYERFITNTTVFCEIFNEQHLSSVFSNPNEQLTIGIRLLYGDSNQYQPTSIYKLSLPKSEILDFAKKNLPWKILSEIINEQITNDTREFLGFHNEHCLLSKIDCSL